MHDEQDASDDICWARQIRMPFFATLPSLLYEQDSRHPCFARFKEARAVHVCKEYPLQLCVQDFSSIGRCTEQFSSSTHHRVFLFLRVEADNEGNAKKAAPCRRTCTGGVARQWVVRGFRLTSQLELQEQTDSELVAQAWKEFLSSPRAQHGVDHGMRLTRHGLAQQRRIWCESERGSGSEEAAVRQAICDLKTVVVVPCWSCLSHYVTQLSEFRAACCSMRTAVMMRLVHRATTNVFADNVAVPLLLPTHELLFPQQTLLPGDCGAEEDALHNDAVEAETQYLLASSRRVRRRMDACRVMACIRKMRQQGEPIMPAGWYRNSLIGARIHCIDTHRKKSMLVCEMLDGRCFRFREAMADVPSSRAERKGFASSSAMLIAESGGQEDEEEEEETRQHDERDDDEEDLRGATAIATRVHHEHDDELPTPRILLAQLTRWKQMLQ